MNDRIYGMGWTMASTERDGRSDTVDDQYIQPRTRTNTPSTFSEQDGQSDSRSGMDGRIYQRDGRSDVVDDQEIQPRSIRTCTDA